MVNFLVNTNITLKATYDCYQSIINSIKDKNFNKFKLIVEHQDKNISDKMKKTLKLYRENPFKYDVNNGIIMTFHLDTYISLIK